LTASEGGQTGRTAASLTPQDSEQNGYTGKANGERRRRQFSKNTGGGRQISDKFSALRVFLFDILLIINRRISIMVVDNC